MRVDRLSHNISMPAVCRVCLCGEASIPYWGTSAGEPLISPCHCKGTMGLYHRTCLEHWLSSSKTTCCEICKFKYETGSRKQGICAYIRVRGWRGEHERRMIAELVSMMIVSPIIIGMAYLGISSALSPSNGLSNAETISEAEQIALVVFSLIILFFYTCWVIAMIVAQLALYKIWQAKNKIVFIIDQSDSDDSLHQVANSSRQPLLRGKLSKLMQCFVRGSPDLSDTPLSHLSHSNQDAVVGVGPDMIRVVNTATVVQQDSTRGQILSTPPFHSSPSSQLQHSSQSPASDAKPTQQTMSPPSPAQLSLMSFRPSCTEESRLMFSSTPRRLIGTGFAATASPPPCSSILEEEENVYDLPPDAVSQKTDCSPVFNCDAHYSGPAAEQWSEVDLSPRLSPENTGKHALMGYTETKF